MLKSLDGLAQMSLPRVLLLTFLVTLLLSFLAHFADLKKAERLSMAPIFLVLSAASLRASFSWPVFLACCLILLALILYGIYGWNSLDERTDLPMTTLERDGLLSHFSVHVSPIYYLLLPIYLLFPTPATLQILQAAVLASSVIPLWKLGKHHGLSNLQQMFLCLLLLLYPAFSGGTAYDLHENCFLAPLLFWLFYGIARQNVPITALAAFLTLMVKEDAAVYTAVIALWLTVKTIYRPYSAAAPWTASVHQTL
ncbi:MAG: DUF2079 domain-containing protein [Lachnospiraceae bacterium]|jgi:hypothetical protein|nr:DUF2079 domain-containing protein [Lachnospiraceae bacterium]